MIGYHLLNLCKLRPDIILNQTCHLSLWIIIWFRTKLEATQFVVVWRHSNSISVILWWLYDLWDEKEKSQAYILTNQWCFNLPHLIGIFISEDRWQKFKTIEPCNFMPNLRRDGSESKGLMRHLEGKKRITWKLLCCRGPEHQAPHQPPISQAARKDYGNYRDTAGRGLTQTDKDIISKYACHSTLVRGLVSAGCLSDGIVLLSLHPLGLCCQPIRCGALQPIGGKVTRTDSTVLSNPICCCCCKKSIHLNTHFLQPRRWCSSRCSTSIND